MPRNPGTGVYTKPSPDVITGTTIESTVYNTFVGDVETDLNTPRPVSSGGTGATNADGALVNVSGEKAAQLVADYNTHLWMPGSFRSAAAANGAPNATSSFVGTAYINEPLANPPTNQNVVLEARDQNDTFVPGRTYVREKKAGVWGPWTGNIYAASFDALAYSGMQVNGAMEVSQETGGNLVTLSSTEKYIVDGWSAAFVHATAGLAAQQASLSGVTNIRMFVTTPMTTLANGDVARFRHQVEGWRVKRLQWGTVNAVPITISFNTYSVVAGVGVLRVGNAAGNRFYHAEFTVPAGAFQTVSITIPGDTIGTWATDNTIGMSIIAVYAGKSATPATPNAWSAAGATQTAASTNMMASASSSVYLWNFVLLPGTQAPTVAQLPLIMRPYDQELFICRRYWQKTYAYADAPGTATMRNALTTRIYGTDSFAPAGLLYFTPEMRSAPTCVIYNPNTSASGQIHNSAAGALVAAFTNPPDTKYAGIQVNNQAGAIANSSNYAHATADARL